MRSLYVANSKDMQPEALDGICATKFQSVCTVSGEQVAHVELMTREQSRNTAWHTLRTGRITASRAHSVLHTDMSKPAPSVLMNITMPNKQFNSKYTKYGKDCEPKALNAYGALVANVKDSNSSEAPTIHLQGNFIPHENPTLRKSGLYIDGDKPFIAASPDAIFECTCHGPKVIEVKCPWKLVNDYEGVKDYIQKDSTCCMKPDFTLKDNHQYYAQVQLQLYVTKLRECHFVMWSPSEIVVSVVQRNDNFITNMLEIFDRFFKTVILPELVTRKVETSGGNVKQKMIHVSDASLEKCTCGKDNTKAMVCCDRCDQWYHFACVGRKRFSNKSGPYYCPPCIKQKTI